MKKKIVSSILALSMTFNIAFVNVYAEDGVDIENTVVDNNNTTTISDSNTGEVTIDQTVKISGLIGFSEDVFPDDLSYSTVVAKIKFQKTDNTGAVEKDLLFVSKNQASFDSVDLIEESVYNITLLNQGDYSVTDYSIKDTYTASSSYNPVEFNATKDADSSTVSVLGYVTFISASYDDIKNTSPKLQFTADGYDTVTVDLSLQNNNGYFSADLVDGVTYTLKLLDMDTYEVSVNTPSYAVKGASTSAAIDLSAVTETKNTIQVTGIVTFPDAEFDVNSFDVEKNIVFTPTKGGETKSVKLEYNGTTTATYDVNLLNNKEYKVTISGIDGYTLSKTFTTPNEAGTEDFAATAKGDKFEKDDDDKLTVTNPTVDEDNETFGKNTITKGEISELPENVTATLSPISTSADDDGVNSDKINTIVKDQKTQTTSGSKTTTLEYDAPLVMFDLDLSEKPSGLVTVTIEFAKITLDKGNADETFLTLFHFDEDGTNPYDLKDKGYKVEFNGNDTDGYTSVTFTTDDFSPFAIAQGYSTVKITQNNSDSSSSSSSSNSSNSSVSAVGSDGTTYYITGNIPTVGFISQLRGVTVGEFINLDKITVTGKIITGWFYDRDFTEEVEDTSNFVITQDVMDNGVYPKFEVVVDTLGASISTYTSDYSINTPIKTNVPSTGVVFGASLF